MTAGWTEFAAAFLAFAGSHFVPRLGNLRNILVARLGRRMYFAVYGGVSLLVLFWLIGAASRAPYVDLWPALPWTRHIPGIVMPIAIFLAVVGIGTRSPFTLGSSRSSAFDSTAPGLAALTRHPLLWAMALWSASHLLPNGDLAHVLLFGAFAVISLAAMPVFDRRARCAQSDEMTERLFKAAPLLSPRPLISPAWLLANGISLGKGMVIAAVVWSAAFNLHLPVVGASPVAG